jgi:hypothetical protein
MVRLSSFASVVLGCVLALAAPTREARAETDSPWAEAVRLHTELRQAKTPADRKLAQFRLATTLYGLRLYAASYGMLWRDELGSYRGSIRSKCR